MMRRRVLLSGLWLGLLVSCGEQAGSGNYVPVPSVRVECTTSRCKATGGSINAFAVFTISGCTNPSFGEVASGSSTVSCNGSGCTGTVTTFVDSGSQSVTSIPDGLYSVCVTIDLDRHYSGTQQAGDSAGDLSTHLRVNAATTVTVSAFTDL